jgi:hypothetical protein
LTNHITRLLSLLRKGGGHQATTGRNKQVDRLDVTARAGLNEIDLGELLQPLGV